MCAIKKTLHGFNSHSKWELTPKVFFSRLYVRWNGTIIIFLTALVSTSKSWQFATIHNVAIQFATICDIFCIFCPKHRESLWIIMKCHELSWSQNSQQFATNLVTMIQDESQYKSLKTSRIITNWFTTCELLWGVTNFNCYKLLGISFLGNLFITQMKCQNWLLIRYIFIFILFFSILAYVLFINY
jgi:hypothetical protein